MNLNEFFVDLSESKPLAALALLFFAAWILFYICRSYLIRIIRSFAKDISSIWVQIFFETKLLSQVSWILPVAMIYLGTQLIPNLQPLLSTVTQRVALSMLVILFLRALTIFLSKVNDVYSTLEISRNRPIKGIIQITLIFLHLLAIILVFAILLDRSPLVFLSGLGAMTAILLLVFRDTLLSLVAGVQLTTNNLIRVGDWLEIPQFGADGSVVDIALHAVRIQNWDKTYTVIPTHKFLEHSFKNWRGMQESGGRRIKRAVYVDMSTIRFLTEEEIEKFSRFALIKDYMMTKKEELASYNKLYAADPNLQVNGRRLTNVGTFRAYLTHYLKQHPRINKDMTFLVRQLAPGPEGLPIEIYVFTNDTRWAVYEEIQADVFDHVLAIISEFDLRVRQNPSGYDFRKGLSESLSVKSEVKSE